MQSALVVISPSRGLDGGPEAVGAGGDSSTVTASLEPTDDTVPGGGQSGGLAGSAGGGGATIDTTPGGRTSTGGSGTSKEPGRLTADKSKCAPGGVLQENVTLLSPPCVPRWVGDNGGATSQGVTKDTITVVYVRVPVPAAFEPIFRAGNLTTTEQEDRASLEVWGRFFEKHYELYNRKIKWVLHTLQCDTASPELVTCERQEMRRINELHRPFAVFQFGGQGPREFYDEAARLGVVSFGGQILRAEFNTSHRPYHYDLFADGDRVARNVAGYWCAKMRAKNATRAGDPVLQTQVRKLGILADTSGSTNLRELGDVLGEMVSGGVCGSAADKPVIVSASSDPTQSAQQMDSAATTFKRADVTTVTCLCQALTPLYMTRAFDNQQYFPEHLITGSGAVDVDSIGRLYTPTQWRNAFGPSFIGTVPKGGHAETDQERAWRDGGGSGRTNPCFVCGAIFIYMQPIVAGIQWAGPILHPTNFEKGMLSAPQIGGWERSGHNPSVPMWKFGPGDYTALEDSKQVRWDPNATSPDDGGQGSYVQIDGGRRYEIGQWPPGEPAQ